MTELAATATSVPGLLSQGRRRAAWGLAFVTGLAFIAADTWAWADPPPHKQATEAPSKDAVLPQVTIRGQREELENHLWAYVGSIIRQPFEASLVRWTRPICPLVVGLARQENKLLAARLSEIAAAAGAQLAHRPCTANFAVILTTEPDAVLEAWYKRDYHIFGEASEHTIDRFIETSQPVRVWYNIIKEGAGPLSNTAGSAALAGKGPTGVPVAGGLEGSRLVFNAVRAFSSVIVTIDSKQVTDFNLHQLADYAAMVGMVEVRPHADVGATTPSILRLFASSTEPAPAGLSAWDTALLKALYTTNNRSRTQRTDIFLRVFHDLAP